MPKRKILPAGELPAWRFTKRPRLEQIESPQDGTVAATADTAKSTIIQTDGERRTGDLARARRARYRERISSQSLLSLNKGEVIESV